MRKNMKKLMALALAGTMALSMAGCGQKAATGDAADQNQSAGTTAGTTAATVGGETTAAAEKTELEPVTLRLYFCGEKPPMADKVWETVSEKYKDQLNCTFKVSWISMGDYKDKMIAMASSGDDWDLNYDGLWQAYSQMVSKDAYLDVKDLLPQYAPDLYDAYMEQGLLDAVEAAGKVYALPWTQTGNQRPWVLWRQDAAEAAGITIEPGSIKTLEDLDVMLHQLKEAYPDQTILGLGTAEGNQGMRMSALKDGYMWADFHTMYYDVNNTSQKLIPMEQTETFREACKRIRQWVEDGIVSEDDMVNKTEDKVRFTNGQTLVLIRNHEEGNDVTAFTDPSFTKGASELYPENKAYNRVPLGNVMCINRNAKNPERALMFLNLLQKDRELYDLVIYGIEGETYVLDGEMAAFPEGMTLANSSYMEWKGQWGLWKSDYMRPTPNYSEGFWKREAEYASEAKNINNPAGALTIITDDIKNELARRDQLYEEYGKPLLYGLVKMDEIDAKVDEYIQMQKDAGLDEILANAQAQVDEFIANK